MKYAAKYFEWIVASLCALSLIVWIMADVPLPRAASSADGVRSWGSALAGASVAAAFFAVLVFCTARITRARPRWSAALLLLSMVAALIYVLVPAAPTAAGRLLAAAIIAGLLFVLSAAVPVFLFVAAKTDSWPWPMSEATLMRVWSVILGLLIAAMGIGVVL